MSQYYSYEFSSIAPLLALVREELRSYIESGAVDDSIWSIYVDKCLRKLGKGSYKIVPTILNICDYEARLPDDFFAVREAWLCTEVSEDYQLPNASYQQVKTTSMLLNPDNSYCAPCRDCNTPDIVQTIYKTTNTVFANYKRQYLLKPGNIWAKGECSADCLNFHANGPESFDIRNNKFTVTFREGNVYLLYYSKEYDDEGYQLIPDNFRIKEYIEAFIKQKVFEQLSNQVTDETYNQIQQKALNYKQLADEAYIMADIETKKETIYDKHRKILRQQNRFDKFQLDYPNRRYRY